MGLFGKSDEEKEQEAQAKYQDAQRKMQEAQRRHEAEEKAKAAAAAAAAKPAAPAPAPQAQAAPASAGAPAAGGNVPAATKETVVSYTVQKGDSLSKIAKRELGDANAWKKIYEANKAVIGDNPDKIFPGQQLRIPR